MPPKIVYAAMTGGFGSLAQVLPILECLDPAKYRIVCSIAHGAAYAVQRLGYEFIPYPDVGTPDPSLVTPKGRECRDLDQYWGRFGFGDLTYFSALVEARLQIVERLKPDLLLTQFCPPTEMIARITGIPLICVTQSCWHPAGKPISWWNENAVAEYVKVAPVINTILTSHGAIPIRRVEDLNQGDLTFIPSFPEFDPIEDRSVHYIGPLSWDSSAKIAGEHGLGEVATSARPLVVVYTGHLYDSAGRSGILILERTVEALKDTELDVLITTGLGQSHDHERGGHPNIRLCDWVGLRPLIQRCALFIHHGGHGSCMAAILDGAVSLVIPTFQEREFNARQLHALGLGDFMVPDRITALELRDKVRTSLHDQAIANNVRCWQAELTKREYGGAYAAKLISESF